MTDNLIDSIKESSYYKRYQECLMNLKKQEEIYEKYNQFRRKYYELTNSGEDNFSEIEKLQQEYHTVLSKTAVVEFMEAEDRICIIMQEMYTMLAENLEFDMDFMNQ